jgi:uncharacterized DUF497 family protein
MGGFEWNEENIAHIARHGVRPSEVEEVFSLDPEFRHFYTHASEERYRAYGFTARGRYLTIAYTERNEKVRPITAWDMTRKEKKLYYAAKIDQNE